MKKSCYLKVVFCILLLQLYAVSFVVAQQPKLMLPIGHTSYIKVCRITPDGKNVITIGDDTKIILWEMQTGLRLAQLQTRNSRFDEIEFNKTGNRVLGIQLYDNKRQIPLWDSKGQVVAQLEHKSTIQHEEFSPDGNWVLTCSLDESAKIWDAQNGKEILSITPEAGIVWTARFSHDGKKLITASTRNATVCDVSTGKSILTLNGHADRLVDAIFSPDDKIVVTISTDKTAKVWNVENGNLLHTLSLGEEGQTAEFSASGQELITKAFNIGNTVIKLWNVSTGKLIETLSQGKTHVRFTAFSNSRQLLAIGTEEKEVKVWELSSGKLLHTLNDHYSGSRAAVFTPDDSRLIVASGSNETKVWDLGSGKLLQEVKGNGNGFTDVELARDGKMLVLPTGNLAQVWNFKKNTLVAELKGSTRAIETLAISPDKSKIITDSRTKDFTRLWSMEKGDLLNPPSHSSPDIDPKSYLYSSSYNKLLRRSKNAKRVEVWDIKTSALQTVFDGRYSAYLNRFVFTPDETKVFCADLDSSILVFDAITGERIRVFNRHQIESVDKLLVTPDGERIIATDSKQNGIIWDIASGKELARMKGMHPKFIDKVEFLGKDNWLLTNSSDGVIKVWNSRTGELIANVPGNKSSLQFYFLSPDQNRLVTSAWYEDKVKLWDLQKNKLIAELPGHKGNLWKVQVSPDWKYIVTQSMLEPTIRIWDSETGKLLHAVAAHQPRPLEVIFSEDGKYLYTRGSDKEARKWNIATGELLLIFTGHKSTLTTIQYNPDSKELLTGDVDGIVKTWNTETGELKTTFSGHTDFINAAIFGVAPNTIITASEDNTIKVWNKSSGKVIYTFFPMGESEYLNQVPEGYYKSSFSAAKSLHYVTDDLKAITFEQLDVKYNRPDKVLDALQADTSIINAYHKAYIKRLKRLGVDTLSFTSSFALPEADFVNRDAVTYEQAGTDLSVHIKGVDASSILDRFNFWINEVPLYGLKGLSLRRRNSHVFDTTLTLTLSEGMNVIETSVTNTNGTESFRMPLQVSYTPAVTEGSKLHFIGIGIDHFADAKHDLNYSVKDIRDLSKKLKEKYGDNILIDTLFNEEVTGKRVAALKQKLLSTSVNDKVILSYSGHGLLSKDYDYYLSTYTVNFQKPEEGGLPYDALESLLDSIPARRKLLLLDACHSGEVDKEEMQRYTRTVSVSKDSTNRGTVVLNEDPSSLGMKNSFELMNQLFVNVGRSTGATVISAAGGTQFAQERGSLQNGVFTYSILEYLNSYPNATVNELKTYVNKRVPELTNGLQQPTSRSENKVVDWKVWEK